MLPEGWSRACVRDVVDESRRVTYGIVQPGPRQERGVPIIRGKDYSSGRVDDTDLYLVSPEVASKYGRSTVRGGDILMSIVGYLGLVAVVPEHLSGANITQTTARVAIAPPNIPEFFFQQFQSRAFQGQVRRYQKGSAQPGLNLADVDKMEVIVPPVPEQQRIAAMLQAVDDAIEAGEAVADQLDRLRRDLAEELVTRGLPLRRHRMKRTVIGTLPESWGLAALSDVGQVQTGLAKGKVPAGATLELPYLRVANVQDGHVDLEEMKTVAVEPEALERYRLRSGDVLFTEGGDFDKLGRGCVWRGQIDPCLHQNHVFAVRTNGELLPDFLAAHAASRRGRAYFLDCAKRTTNLASINSTQLKAMPVPLPPLDEQRAIVDAVGTVIDRIAKARADVAERRRVKAALADALLTGKIRVPEAQTM